MNGLRVNSRRLLWVLVLLACAALILGAEEPSGCTQQEQEEAARALSGDDTTDDGAAATTPAAPTDKDGNLIITKDDVAGVLGDLADGALSIYGSYSAALDEVPSTGDPANDPYIIGWNLQNVGPDGLGNPAVVDFGNSSAPDDGVFRVVIENGVVETEQLTLDEAFVSPDELQAFPLPPDSPAVWANMDHECPTLDNVIMSGWTPIPGTPALMVFGNDPQCFPEGAEWFFDPITGDPLPENTVLDLKVDWN